MKSLIMTILVNFLSVDTICALLARCVSKLLKYASSKGGKAWDIAKSIIVKLNTWTSLFIQVYDDETLTPEEEDAIAEAIKNETDISKIINILKKSKKKTAKLKSKKNS